MDAERKAKLGTRWACYSCGAKFYDLGKPEPLCPRCQADQRQSPEFAQPKSKRARPAKKAPVKPVAEPRPVVLESESDSESDSEIDFEDVDLIAPEGIGLDTDDDDSSSEGPEEADLD